MDLQQADAQKHMKGSYRALVIISIVIVSINLRPGMTAVGPLLGIIRDDVGISNWSAGLLTSLPLVAFAVISPIVPRLGVRFTNERAMIFGLALLAVGIGIRSISLIYFIFIGTIIVGLGIAICNVLLPGIVKEKFPLKVGLMTSVYSTTMGVFAAISSGLSIPFARGLGWGWQISLLVWTVPAVVGIVVWIILARRNKRTEQVAMQYVSSDNWRIWRSPLAWQVALYMGLQSSLFYVTISWLPEILHSYGVTMNTAGWLLSYAQLIGMPISFFIPMIAGRLKSQRSIVLVMGVCAISGYLTLLLFGSNYIAMVISATLIGISLGGSFALALTFLGIRAKNAKHAGELSGMAQSIGYSFAAVGPVLIGFLFDLTRSWQVPITTLAVIALFVVMFGLGAGRNKYVFES